jgi:hypothetical protein
MLDQKIDLIKRKIDKDLCMLSIKNLFMSINVFYFFSKFLNLISQVQKIGNHQISGKKNFNKKGRHLFRYVKNHMKGLWLLFFNQRDFIARKVCVLRQMIDLYGIKKFNENYH